MGCTPTNKNPPKDTIVQRSKSFPPALTESLELLFSSNPRRAKRIPDEVLEELAAKESSEVKNTARAKAPKSSVVKPQLPNIDYTPYHVYGYNGHTFRNNLFFTAAKNLVYPAAALGIVMNPLSNSQSFFGGNSLDRTIKQHDDDIICLAISGDRKKAASGQAGSKPKLFIWKIDTCEHIATYALTNTKACGVAACCFSRGGEFVALVEVGSACIVHVVNADDGSLVWSQPSEMSVVEGMAWSDEKTFVICGKTTVKFWNTETQESVEENKLDTAAVTCIASDGEGHCYLGSLQGTLYILDGCNVASTIEEVHKTKVNIIAVLNANLITGGNDKKVVVRDKGTYVVQHLISCDAIPQAVDLLEDALVIGDSTGKITLYQSGKKAMQWLGHYSGELCGLDINDDIIVSCGEDNQIIVWDYHKRRAMEVGYVAEKPGSVTEDGNFAASQCSRVACINMKSEEIAIAANSGEVHIRDLYDIRRDKKVLICGKKLVECVRYSPNDNMLAVGTHDNIVYIFNVPEYDLKSRFKAHAAPIICVDWSVDEKHLRSLDEKYEVTHWDMTSLSQDKNGPCDAMKIEWDTQGCKVDWSHYGAHPVGTSRPHISEIARSKDNLLIATGDEWGLISVYNYPFEKGARCVKLRGHSDCVKRIVFSQDDRYIFSVGGADKTMIQWMRK